MSDFEDDNILVDVAQFKEKINKSAKTTLFKVIARSFFSILTLALIFSYLLSPMGKVKINKLSGNYFLNEEDVLNIANVSKDDSLLKIHEDVLMNKLNDSSYIASSKVKWHMTYLDIYIDEVAPMTKSDGEVILSNGISFDDYKMRHSDYVIPKKIQLPEFIDYISSNDSASFLNSLKCLDKELFQTIEYLDERVVTFDNVSFQKYFGVYFRQNDDLFRIQFEKSIISDALAETKVLKDAINDYKSFNTMYIDEIEKEVYEGVYRYDKNSKSYKVVKLEERS